MVKNIYKIGSSIIVMFMLVCIVWLVGCNNENPVEPAGNISWDTINDFVYVLQMDDIDLNDIEIEMVLQTQGHLRGLVHLILIGQETIK